MDYKSKSIWNFISTDYICPDEEVIYVDAWKTNKQTEEGKIIAKIKKPENTVEYLDERAMTDKYAQEEIRKAIEERDICW